MALHGAKLRATAARARALSLSSTTLFDAHGRPAIQAFVNSLLQPAIRLRDVVNFDIKSDELVPIPHSQFINAVEVVVRKPHHPQHRTRGYLVGIKLLTHDAEAKLQGSCRAFMEDASQRRFFIDKAVFDMKSMDAFLHAFKMLNVFGVVFNNEFSPLS